jgi:hypothetical protein
MSEEQKARHAAEGFRRGLLLTVFALHFFFLFHVALFDRFQFQRAGRDHFEVGATLGAGDDLAFVDFVFLDVQIGFAFGTKNHDFYTPFDIAQMIS